MTMVTALILMQVERAQINVAAQSLADIPGISEVYSVSGQFDLAAVARVKANEDLADLVTERLHAVSGILRTETLIAFRTYSRHDLEGMFAVGME
jgi:DNA-binding Lrp family transcriptional regulator